MLAGARRRAPSKATGWTCFLPLSTRMKTSMACRYRRELRSDRRPQSCDRGNRAHPGGTCRTSGFALARVGNLLAPAGAYGRNDPQDQQRVENSGGSARPSLSDRTCRLSARSARSEPDPPMAKLTDETRASLRRRSRLVTLGRDTELSHGFVNMPAVSRLDRALPRRRDPEEGRAALHLRPARHPDLEALSSAWTDLAARREQARSVGHRGDRGRRSWRRSAPAITC